MSSVELKNKPRLDHDEPPRQLVRSSLSTELISALEVIDVVSKRLASAADGVSGDLRMTDIVDSLRETRGRVLTQAPIILWENPLISNNNLHEEQIPTVSEIQKPDEVRDEGDILIRVSSLSNLIKVPPVSILSAVRELDLDMHNPQANTGHKVSWENAQVLIAHFTKKKIDDQVFSGISDELLSLSEVASRLGVDVGLVVEAIGRLGIVLVGGEDNSRGTVSLNYLKAIGEFTQRKAAMLRLMSYSRQVLDDKDEEEVADLSVSKPMHDLVQATPVKRDSGSYAQPDKENISGIDVEFAPDGLVSTASVCKELGISEKTWFGIARKKYGLTAIRIGHKGFYRKEDIQSIAEQRKKEAEFRSELRVTRMPRFEKEFEKEHAEVEESSSDDLSLMDLFFSDISKIPIDVKKHKLWAAKIAAGQLALLILNGIKDSHALTVEQKRQVDAIIQNNVSKIFLDQLNKAYEQRTLKTNKDRADEQLIKSYDGAVEFARNLLEKFEKYTKSGANKLKLQGFINHELAVVNRAFSARESLTSANQRLVVSRAKKFLWSGLALSDLIGYAQSGLMIAAVRWDFRKGYKFSTYATNWIDQSIRRAIADYGNTIRLPTHIHERLGKLSARHRKAIQETGEDLDLVRFIDDSNEGTDTKFIKQAVSVRGLASLNLIVHDEGNGDFTELGEFVEDDKVDLERDAHLEELKLVMREVLDTLSPRERKVISLRFGIEDGRARKLDEIGTDLGVTRERIRQIESKALRKLRHSSRSRKLRPFADSDKKSIRTTGAQELQLKRDRSKNRQAVSI